MLTIIFTLLFSMVVRSQTTSSTTNVTIACKIPSKTVCQDRLSNCSGLQYNDGCRSPSEAKKAKIYCRKTCGYCGTGACFDVSTKCLSSLMRSGQKEFCLLGGKKCCATCRDVKGGIEECTDEYKGCSSYELNGKCRLGSAGLFAQKNCRKTCGYCANKCTDTSTQCTKYMHKYDPEKACKLFGKSCCASCEEYSQEDSKCHDKPSLCNVYSKSYTCKNFNNTCCSRCKNYYVYKNCFDKDRRCHTYNKTLACGKFKSVCCGTCRDLGGDRDCVDVRGDCEERYGRSYACSEKREECCATCNYQVDPTCFDKSEYCHKEDNNTVCGWNLHKCCASCRKFGGDYRACFDNYDMCSTKSRSFMCYHHKGPCCATCKNYTVDKNCRDWDMRCNDYDEISTCRLGSGCCGTCKEYRGGNNTCEDLNDECSIHSKSYICHHDRGLCCATCKNYKGVHKSCYDDLKECHTYDETKACGTKYCCGTCVEFRGANFVKKFFELYKEYFGYFGYITW